MEPGEGRDSRPHKGQNVKINLTTFLKDGTPVDEQPNLSFTLGDGDVIQVLITHFKQFSINTDVVVIIRLGIASASHFSKFCFNMFPIQALDLTVQLMEMGETALIHTEAKYAYGAQGR